MQRSRVLDVRDPQPLGPLLAARRPRRPDHRLHGQAVQPAALLHLLPPPVRRHPRPERPHRRPAPLDAAHAQADLRRQQPGRLLRRARGRGVVGRHDDGGGGRGRGRQQFPDDDVNKHVGVGISVGVTSPTAGAHARTRHSVVYSRPRPGPVMPLVGQFEYTPRRQIRTASCSVILSIRFFYRVVYSWGPLYKTSYDLS